jgi:hypothetical protein
MYRTLALFLLLCSVPVLRAQDAAYIAQYNAMQKANGTEAMQRAMLEATLDMQEKDPNMDPEFLKRFRKEVLGRLDELNAEIATLYFERFSIEELQELTAFYETPAGRKLAKEGPELVEASAKVGAAWGERVALEVLEKMQ